MQKFIDILNYKYYLYRWIREDKNCPFYVGIGTNNKYYSYSRAKSKTNRKQSFLNILNKTNCYYEILMESNNYDFIKNKEVEFIKLYGRKDLGLGQLVNLTDGGDGTLGKEKLKGGDNKCSKKIYQYNLNGDLIKKWQSIADACRELNYNNAGIIACCKKKRRHKTYKGFIWRYNLEKVKSEKIGNDLKIKQYDINGNFIQEWNSISEVSKKLKILYSRINYCLKIKYKTYFNYYWRYSYEDFILVNKGRKKGKTVIDNTTGKIYISITELSYDINKSISQVSRYIRNKNNSRFEYYE